MCGIAGFSAPTSDAPHLLDRMLLTIAHRGPDGSGTFIDRGVALGHRRLAIVDLAGGAQPRVDEASNDAMSFNGEIYGFRALADELKTNGVSLRDSSDTEVLFQLIRRHGIRRAVSMVTGMFAFAFRDGTTGAIHLVRDRFGEKPLYYGVVAGQIVFASEVSAILSHPAFDDSSVDMTAAFQLLQFEYVPGSASGWSGIWKVPPATILTFENDTVTLDRYWRPNIGGATGVSESEAIETIDGTLTKAVRNQLVADVPVGVFLSGGLDSSLITAIAARVSPDITAFTVRIAGHGFDETPYAVQVARHVGVRHEIVALDDGDITQAFDDVLEHLAEPLADSSLLPTWLVCRAARKSMTVALGGDGADELFAGYPNFAVQRFAWAMRGVPPRLGAMLERSIAALPAQSGYMNWHFLASQLAQGFGQLESRQSFLWMAPFGPRQMSSIWARDVLPAGLQTSAFAPLDAAAADADVRTSVDRLLHQFLVTYLPDDILMKTDRAAMYNSLEVRAPFLDSTLANYVCGLPSAFKLNGKKKKYILKAVAEKYLTADIITRKKHGFGLPIGDLLRGAFRSRCYDILTSRDNPVASWFDSVSIDRMLAEHMSGQKNHGKRLWSLLVLFMVAGRRRASAPSPLRASFNTPI